MTAMGFADLELAKMLQTLGYDGDYTHWWVEQPWNTPRLEVLPADNPKYADGTSVYAAPRLDDVAYWIREKYSIHIAIIPSYSAEREDAFCYQIWKYFSDGEFWSSDTCVVNLPHDDALKAGIMEVINAIFTTK